MEQMPHEEKCAVHICHGGFAGARDFVERLRLLGPSSFVLALVSPFFALTLGSVQKILLSIALLDIPFQFGTHLFYREQDAATGALGGLSISATTMALFGLYLSWFLRSMAVRNRYSRPSIDFNLPLVFYLAFASLSLFAAQDVSLAFYELFLLLQLYLVYVYVANNVRTRRDLLFVMSLLLVGCLIEGLAMIALRFTGMPSTIWGLPTHIHIQSGAREAFMRIGGTIGSSNEASAYLSLLLAVAASFLFANIGRSHKWLAAVVLGIGGGALILTFARGGWIAFILALVMICFLIWRRGGLPLKAPIAILAILILLYLPFSGDISTRLFGDDKGSAESRIPLTYLAFRIIRDYPVLGAGSNNFSVVMDRYLTPEFRNGFIYAVHNKYLLIWAETGIGGLLAYLAFLFGSLRKGWECWKQSDRFMSVLALGFTAAIIGHMVHMSVDLFRVGPVQELLWLFAALLTAMRRMSAAPSASDAFSGVT
jgi:putative inorganic carbon (HCO3(-)) transporter